MFTIAKTLLVLAVAATMAGNADATHGSGVVFGTCATSDKCDETEFCYGGVCLETAHADTCDDIYFLGSTDEGWTQSYLLENDDNWMCASAAPTPPACTVAACDTGLLCFQDDTWNGGTPGCIVESTCKNFCKASYDDDFWSDLNGRPMDDDDNDQYVTGDEFCVVMNKRGSCGISDDDDFLDAWNNALKKSAAMAVGILVAIVVTIIVVAIIVPVICCLFCCKGAGNISPV